MTDEWLMRVEGGLAAHYKVPDGPSRPGVQWAIGLKRGDETHTALVKALFADDASPETQKDQAYQSQIAMQYLSEKISAGWHPSDESEHTIYISNPPGRSAGPSKSWWKRW